jgi:hypothetical protein
MFMVNLYIYILINYICDYLIYTILAIVRKPCVQCSHLLSVLLCNIVLFKINRSVNRILTLFCDLTYTYYENKCIILLMLV